MSINENTKPRALLLLRVSTAKQANGNDDCLLPVQQEKCTALCEENGWKIVGTITETKSAYKNGMYERESIIDIANRTSNNEFDILVAFKLDRIGRKGNETTNFITSLLEKGIWNKPSIRTVSDQFEGLFFYIALYTAVFSAFSN